MNNNRFDLLQISFTNCVSQIIKDAWELQKPILVSMLSESTKSMSEVQKEQYFKGIYDIVLTTQRWWTGKQNEFVLKLIDDYKNNIFFRQIAQESENDLDKINENLKNKKKMTELMESVVKKKLLSSIFGNYQSKLEDKIIVVNELLNRIFRDFKDDAYISGDEYISSLPYILRVGLIDDLTTYYLSGDYGEKEMNTNAHTNKYNMQYVKVLPMRFANGTDVNPMIDLQYFIRYFECYTKFITNLLKIDIDDEPNINSSQVMRSPVLPLIQSSLRKGGSKKIRKYMKRITSRKINK